MQILEVRKVDKKQISRDFCGIEDSRMEDAIAYREHFSTQKTVVEIKGKARTGRSDRQKSGDDDSIAHVESLTLSPGIAKTGRRPAYDR